MLNRPGSGGSNPPASAKGSLAQLDGARRYERRCWEFSEQQMPSELARRWPSRDENQQG